MKVFILVLVMALGFLGCSSESEEVPQDNIAQGGGEGGGENDQGIGPFNLKLTQNGGLEANQFSVQIAQNEGKVEFNLAESEKTVWMKIRSHLATVTECDSKKVEVAHFWKSKKDGNVRIVSKGDYFSSLPDEEGQLTVAFTNMNGCSTLTYKLVIDEIADPYEIPKSWGFQVDPIFLGNWQNKTENLVLEIDEFYINIISDKAGSCFRSIPNIVTDNSQTPHFIGQLTADNLLCEYDFSKNNLEVNVTCHHISNWICPAINNITLQKMP